MISQKIKRSFAPISRWCSRIYIKNRYWFVVNDLTVRQEEQYSTEGIYPTMYRKVPANYHRRLRKRVFNEDNVPLYKNKDDYVLNPIQIVQYGLEEYGYYKVTGENQHLERLMSAVTYLEKNIDIDGKWEMPFTFFTNGLVKLKQGGYLHWLRDREFLCFAGCIA